MRAGRRRESAAAVEEALGLFEHKGDVPEAGRARALLEEISG